MARQGHKGHPDCAHTSKAACEKARRIAIGQCVSMIEEDRQCANWGIDKVDERAYCGQHLAAVFMAADKAKRDAERHDAMIGRIDRALLWHVSHSSVWDLMPANWDGTP